MNSQSGHIGPILLNNKVLKILLEIKKIEDMLDPEFKTISGRYLYYKLASILLFSIDSDRSPLKSLNDELTDRAIRTKLRDLQMLGLIKLIDSQRDGRCKLLVPTEKYLGKLKDHMDRVSHIMKYNGFFID